MWMIRIGAIQGGNQHARVLQNFLLPDSTGCREVSGMETTCDPKDANNVWPGFSNVKRNEIVFNYHAAVHNHKNICKKGCKTGIQTHVSQLTMQPLKKLVNNAGIRA